MKPPAMPKASCLDPSARGAFDQAAGTGGRGRVSVYAETAAARWCLSCPERKPCLEWALLHAEGPGVWAGLGPTALGKLRAKRGVAAERLSYKHGLRDGDRTGGQS